MIVEVIACQVREQRDVERDAVDAALVEPVRGHFHRHRLRAFAQPLRQRLLRATGIGRCIRRRRQRAGEAVAERSHDGRAPPAGSQRLRDPVRARRLAVRARDADHEQRLRRAAVDGGRDRTEP